MIDVMASAVLMTSVMLVVYSYVLYPLLLILIGSFYRDRTFGKVPDTLPAVTVVIAAYNEAECIQDRIANLLSLDYPPDKLKIVVGDDGSVDETPLILKQIANERVISKCFETNRGKASVLNDLISDVRGSRDGTQVLVLTDANTHFEHDAVKNLVRHFDSAEVGAVCGELKLEGSQYNQDGVYWRYEQFLKKREARAGGLLGANGAIYAIRPELYEPLPEDTLVDDFTIVMKISLKGNDVIYDDSAVARETVAPSVRDEYARRVRIGAGNFQAFSRLPGALHPRHGMLTFSYVSHKVLRWFTPLLVLAAGLSLAALSLSSPTYLALLLVSLSLVAASLVLARLQSGWVGFRLLGLWVVMNVALLQGLIVFLRGIEDGSWQSTDRT